MENNALDNFFKEKDVKIMYIKNQIAHIGNSPVHADQYKLRGLYLQLNQIENAPVPKSIELPKKNYLNDKSG